MKETRFSIQCLTISLLLVLGLSLSGCKSSGDRSWAMARGDRQVAANVKKELSKDSTYQFRDVEVVCYDGNVQLGGFVNSPEQKARAGQLAMRATGVRGLVNSIALKPTPTGPSLSETNAPDASATPEPPRAPPPAPETPEPTPTPNP